MEQNNNLKETQCTEWQNNSSAWKERMEKMQKEKEEEASHYFGLLGISSFIYAIIFTFCLYKNLNGITNPIFSISTAYYMYYMGKKFDKKFKSIHYFSSCAIILLGFSNFLTGNGLMTFYNYIAMLILFSINMALLFFDFEAINILGHLRFIMDYGFGILEVIITPFSHLLKRVKKTKEGKSEKTKYIIIGFAIAIPLFFIMYAILSSADEVFHQIFKIDLHWLNPETFLSNSIGIFLTFAFSFCFPYAAIFKLNLLKQEKIKSIKKENNPIIPIIVAGSISLLYVAFSLIQIIFLFMRSGTLPEGYTYAEYAREGFFQLLFVSIVNGFAILICMELFLYHKVLKFLLLVISGCTFIMIASSAFRMSMYIETYGLTSYRIFVLWGLLVIFLLMLGLIYQMFVPTFSLFNYALIVSTLCFIVLSFSHYDYWIAKYNFERYESIQKHQNTGTAHANEQNDYEEEYFDSPYVDYGYFMELSVDAAPIISEHFEEIFSYIEQENISLDEVNWYPYSTDPSNSNFRRFNLSRYIASHTIPNKIK